MMHLDLFSGIGGFALAADRVWNNCEHIFCDNDLFAQAVLKKHWPDSIIYDDIKTLTAERIIADAKSGESWEQTKQKRRKDFSRGNIKIDLLTGGFPCQPFSQAGRRKGTEDDRYLWPEMLRLIRETLPRWIIGENVRGFVTWSDGLVLETVCTDLESLGYEVQPVIIPACAVEAPHRRDRVWIIAHNISDATGSTHGGEIWRGSREDENKCKGCEVRSDASDGDPQSKTKFNDSDAEFKRLERSKFENGKRYSGQCHRDEREKKSDWAEDWPQVAAELCLMDDGLSNGLVRPRGWRNASLKAAGNAIVPQVAEQIMKAIKSLKKPQ